MGANCFSTDCSSEPQIPTAAGPIPGRRHRQGPAGGLACGPARVCSAQHPPGQVHAGATAAQTGHAANDGARAPCGRQRSSVRAATTLTRASASTRKDLEIEAEDDGLDKDPISKRLEEIHKRLQLIDADAAEARAASILAEAHKPRCTITTNLNVRGSIDKICKRREHRNID